MIRSRVPGAKIDSYDLQRGGGEGGGFGNRLTAYRAIVNQRCRRNMAKPYSRIGGGGLFGSGDVEIPKSESSVKIDRPLHAQHSVMRRECYPVRYLAAVYFRHINK